MEAPVEQSTVAKKASIRAGCTAGSSTSAADARNPREESELQVNKKEDTHR